MSTRFLVSYVRLLVGASAALLREAVRAVHRSVAAGEERNFRFLAAVAACDGVHLAWAVATAAAAAAAAASLCLACLTAARAALGLGVALHGEELLIISRMDECRTAVSAGAILVCVGQVTTPFLVRPGRLRRARVEFRTEDWDLVTQQSYANSGAKGK